MSIATRFRQSRWGHLAWTLLRRPNWGIVRNAMGSPPWHSEPDALPWFDRPDALATLTTREGSGELAPEEAALFRRWVEDGYFVVDDAVPAEEIDRFNAEVDRLTEATSPDPKLRFLGVRVEDEGSAPRDLTHAQLLAFPLAERRRMLAASNWRIHALHASSAEARRLFHNPRLLAIASKLFAEPARPLANITFRRGSEQGLHQDMAVFHIYPRNFLAGVWIACEDISPDAGPLLILPGSHRAESFPGFVDYPQTNLRTVSLAIRQEYDRFAQTLGSRYRTEAFTPRKGQALFWHGMLLHGGAPVTNPALTRRSFVVHFDVARANRENQVLGPFNWT